MVLDDELANVERDLLSAAVARLRASVMAVVFGLTGGSLLFVATVWLLVRDGNDVGVHLGLLRNYFPGYGVTWVGAFVGFCYGAITGALLGWAIAWTYNRVVGWRHGSVKHPREAATEAVDPGP